MNTHYHTDSPKSTFGYVYLIKSDSGHYKIGKSKTPKARAGEFSLQLPFKIQIVDFVACENYSQSERFLHQLFSAYHVNGEWFAFPPHGDFILKSLRWHCGDQLSEASTLIEQDYVQSYADGAPDEIKDLGVVFLSMASVLEAKTR